MPSERVQRQIDRLLDQAESSSDGRDWQAVAEAARAALALDTANEDAAAYLKMAEANLGTAATTPGAPPPQPAPVEGAGVSTSAVVPALPESFAAGRYHVERFLGEGGKKRVFLAHDALLDRDVAFSLIKTDGLDDTGRERIMREAQAMGRLAHPHIVSIYDIGEHTPESGTAQPYLVQELMGGGDVEALLAKEGGALPLAQVLRIGDAVAQGLEYAHAQGVVHRDLKPGNVWLTADGVPKIGDFGLAVTLGRSRLTTHGMMVGTFQYMPPEQALGAEVTPRADLYSLGAMLYELVTGRPPFQGETPTAVISQHLNAPPVAPSWYSDHCPPALEALILRLLAKLPDDRPANAAEVRAALASVDPQGTSASHSDSQANPLDRLARGVFVGRERELEQLQAALDGALQGRGSVVMLVGEPGIGKTRTVQELETYARLRGAEVYWGRTHESSGMPAYWPWIQVGGAWGATHDVVARAAQGILPNPEMVRLFPDLRRLLPGLPAPSERTDESAQFLLFEAYTQFMRRESAETPWVVVLDDLHWADKPTLQLLQYVARELANMRVLVIGTYRDTDLARTHPLSEALAELNRGAGFQRVLLRGLGRAEVGEYIRQRANVPVAEAVAARIFEETEGNPFFLSQVVNLMAEEGTLARANVTEIALPDGVRETLGRRLDRLSEEANALLQVAAIAGREFAYDTLTLLGDREPDELLRLIEEALDARVVEETGRAGRYQFTHALMQETLLEELSTTRRVRLHGQVAEALERRWGVRADEYATRLALHYAESATLTPQHAAKAVHYLVLAGKQAEANFAWAEAARLYERAVTLMDESEGVEFPDDSASTLAALGRTALIARRFRDFWRASMRALDLYRGRGDGAGFARTALVLNTVPGVVAYTRLVPIWEEAQQLLGDANEALSAALVAELDVAAAATSEPLVGPRNQAMEVAERLGLVDVAARMRYAAAMRAFQDGDFESAIATWHDINARPDGVPGFLLALAVLWEAVAEQAAGRLDRARGIQADALAASERTGDQTMGVNNAAILAGIYSARGELEAFGQLEQRFAETRDRHWLGVRARHALFMGDTDGALALLPRTEEAGGVPAVLQQTHSYRAGVLAHLQDWERAGTEYRGMSDASLARGNRGLLAGGQVTRRDLGGFASNYLADGLAWRLVEGAEREALQATIRGEKDLRLPRSENGGLVQRMLADCGVGLEMYEDAERLYRDALAWCQRERVVIEEGRCWQGLAEIAERRGEHLEALAHLDRAGALFAQHGAKFFLDQVIAKKEILRA